MVFSPTGYTDPQAAVALVNTPGSISTTQARTLCIVGIAPRVRRYDDEAVVRGKVYDETLTAWTAATPFRCVLANPSNRDRNAAILYKNGLALGLGQWSFVPAFMTGTEWAGATIDVSAATGTDQYFTLKADDKIVVTIDMDAAVTAVAGVPAAATGAKIAEAINYELSNAAGTYFAAYGAAYSAFASSATGVANPIITLTSPITTSVSDIKILTSLDETNDAASLISNTAWAPQLVAPWAGVQADTYVEVIDAAYSATATWTIEYVTIETQTDPLDNAIAASPLSDILSVGSYIGTASYTDDYDYEVTGNTIDWLTTDWAIAIATATIIENYNIVAGTNDELKFSINGIDPITVTLSPGAAQTAALVAVDINTALDASADYGPLFSHVASDAGGFLRLTAPYPFENYPVAKGEVSEIVFYTATDDAFATFFGATTQPYAVNGTGKRPSFGTTYYVTYEVTRATTDYNTPQLFYNPDQMYAYTGPLTDTNYTVNLLAIAGEIGWENRAPRLGVCQINDSTAPGTPTATQVKAAIDGCETKDWITEVVALDCADGTSGAELSAYLMNHVASMSAPLAKKYRRAWFGMARSTDVGDPDTPNTFVHRSTQTLQPGVVSPARGRLILVAPSEADRVLTLNDGTEVTYECHSSYMAVAVAALYTSFTSPADPLMRQDIVGFVTSDDSFETYLDGERHTLASQGVTVVTKNAGRLTLLDPITTEGGGSNVIQFKEISNSACQDAVSSTVTSLLDANAVGVVPDDLADFVADSKTWIMLGILANINNGTIAPFVDANGNIRDIDPSTDIWLEQSSTDPSTYYFRYWYRHRYVSKYFWGEYSVDNPFWTAEG